MMSSILEVRLNSQPARFPAGTTVRQLVEQQTGKQLGSDGRAADGSKLGVAVAVDGAVVPRSAWHAVVLPAGAQIDVVTAAQGG